ncbi:MAG: ferrous iron transport protein B [Oscillospiraceae bacterium]|jgi:ferrous iron transport protein B|nr:ferrous iron transport protein B [Oscillospiraceae bacterium]
MPTIALAGNPNCGKTTLFNALTGSNQFTGNWPGVTVEKKEGRLLGNRGTVLLDLPGVYSLSPFSPEERITREALLRQRPDAILNLVDGSNLERNLYLTTQLLELQIPVLVAVNFLDVVLARGDVLDLHALAKELGCPVVAVSALKGDRVAALAAALPGLASQPAAVPWCRFPAPAEAALNAIEASLPASIQLRRFYAIKIFEGDPLLLKEVPDKAQKPAAEGDSIIAGGRYDQIGRLCAQCVRYGRRKLPGAWLDSVLLNRWLALPLFALLMFLVYYISVSTLGAWLSEAIGEGVFGGGISAFGYYIPGIPGLLEGLLLRWHVSAWMQSILLEGLLGGVGTLLGFVPQMVLLFFCLAFLEGCGYLSRIAFVLDRLFRRFGLSGRSFLPMLLATGCGVPGILAARTIENERERRLSIITCTFLPCSAKLPLIALIAGALFGGAWWIAPSAYLCGLTAILLSAALLGRLKIFPGGEAPFVLELPPYRLPSPANLLRSVRERTASFLKKAGTVILLSALLVWFLSNVKWEDGGLHAARGLSEGLLAALGRWVAPLFAPLGFGNWQAAVATFTGWIAKENVVSTLGILYGFGGGDGAPRQHLGSAFTPLAGYSFLLFNLLCSPCVAAVSAIQREMGSRRWTLLALAWQTGFAYLAALAVYQAGRALGG